MKDLISIIVPVYNVELYLDKCINSIINQTYTNIEIILVDDGSTDASGNICDTYAKLDNRIKVVHQKNSGLTVTRRVGVNLAKGAYIGFVDGDDWINFDMYQKLLSIASENYVDIVTSSGYREYEWGRGTKILGDTIPSGKYEINESVQYLLTHVLYVRNVENEYVNGAVWNKLFRLNIIKNVLNEMDDMVHGIMDDTVCVVGSILRSKNIYVSKEILYHHRERNDAFTYSKNQRGLLQLNYAYLNLERLIKNSKYKGYLLEKLNEYMSIQIIEVFNNFFEDEKYKIPKYFFKSKQVPYDSKVVIYGAGNVGKSYYIQFLSEQKYEVIAIVDKQVTGVIGNQTIQSIQAIKSINFEFIVIIAVENRKFVKEIKNTLIQMGIKRNKIIWEQPITLPEYYCIF